MKMNNVTKNIITAMIGIIIIVVGLLLIRPELFQFVFVFIGALVTFRGVVRFIDEVIDDQF